MWLCRPRVSYRSSAICTAQHATLRSFRNSATYCGWPTATRRQFILAAWTIVALTDRLSTPGVLNSCRVCRSVLFEDQSSCLRIFIHLVSYWIFFIQIFKNPFYNTSVCVVIVIATDYIFSVIWPKVKNYGPLIFLPNTPSVRGQCCAQRQAGQLSLMRSLFS